MNKLVCSIYRSSKKDGMYLFVDKQEDIARVPAELLELFGKPTGAMTLLLTPEKKLARADAKKVMEQIQNHGFYLQMPPQDESYMREINIHNNKLF